EIGPILLANSRRWPIGRSLGKMGPRGRRNPGLSRDPGEFANSIRSYSDPDIRPHGYSDPAPPERSELSCASPAGNTGERTPDVAPRWRSEMIEWIERHWVVAAAGAGVVATWSACFIITFLRAHEGPDVESLARFGQFGDTFG